jgi:hypothetical protein
MSFKEFITNHPELKSISFEEQKLEYDAYIVYILDSIAD